ncbi:DUF6384 family protein [Desulfosediminicola ganghwensis]|uniref:DUF6384 family protein n=1 Tax=Desulfosediminicola ganghwensis TaxID=2569540 RepID=UPI0010AC8AC1|nr:DUF6384 family protein [Desulfosediminicola ganghwensis]
MSEQQTVSEPLDEVMLAMDVVDTLRYRSRLIERELNADVRDEELKQRLRKIYKAQGIEVSDEALDEGVKALRDDRFSYQPPTKSFQTKLATLYVNRHRWGKAVLGALTVVGVILACYYYLVVAPGMGLPTKLDSVYKDIKQSAKVDEKEGRRKAEELYQSAKTALEAGDKQRAEQLVESMDVMNSRLQSIYTLQIVNKPGEKTGVWRVPDANTSALNYYILVEAIGPDGSPVPVAVQSEETGRTETVTTWGVRVDKEVFDYVARDKLDDGIIQDNVFGVKRRGYLEPEYRMKTTGAAITSW